MIDKQCQVVPQGRRRLFWATQLDCGTEPGHCDTECAVPGLKIVDVRDHCYNKVIGCHDPCPQGCPCDGGPLLGRTISNDNYIRGIAINILMTDGHLDTAACPVRPGQRGGHWSDCFRDDQGASGSTIRMLPTNCDIAEAERRIQSAIRSDLDVLRECGLVSKVEADVEYVGGGSFDVNIRLIAYTDQIEFGISGQRLDGAWIWEAQAA